MTSRVVRWSGCQRRPSGAVSASDATTPMPTRWIRSHRGRSIGVGAVRIDPADASWPRGALNLLNAVAPGGTLFVVSHDFEPMRAAIDTHQHSGPFDPDAYLRVEDFAAALADAPTDTTSCPSVL